MTKLRVVTISGADWAFGEFTVPASEFCKENANEDGTYIISFAMGDFIYIHDGVIPLVDYMFPSFGWFATVRLTQDTIVDKRKIG
jgi:hypothetical protein